MVLRVEYQLGSVSGGDLDSTAVTKPKVHVEGVVVLVNQNTTKLLVANKQPINDSWDVALAA